jgi:hypothetical protein
MVIFLLLKYISPALGSELFYAGLPQTIPENRFAVAENGGAVNCF